MMYRNRGSTRRWITITVLMVGVLATHLMLVLEEEELRSLQQQQQPKFQWKLWQRDSLLGSPQVSLTTSDDDDDNDGDDNSFMDDKEDPFPPPLYGYDSMEDLLDRPNRFPSVQQRVQVYMSNWYLPPCPHSVDNGDTSIRDHEVQSGFVHYRYVGGAGLQKEGDGDYPRDDDDDDNNNNSRTDDNGATPPRLLVREISSQAAHEWGHPAAQREFALEAHNGLGKVRYLRYDKMLPDQCDSEYCADMRRHWFPAVERVLGRDAVLATAGERDAVPVLFQFSDDERSRAYSAATRKNEPYPNLPHLKKFRLSLRPEDIFTTASKRQQCEPVPKAILPTAVPTEPLPEHLQPIIFKLKTKRHFGMVGSIPSQDLPWSEKKDQAVFRGTLTGLLPPDSRFGLATRNSQAPTLSDADAEEKCFELDRCRLVYQANKHVVKKKKKKPQESQLVDAKLVTTRLQHTDMPNSIHGVDLFGGRKNKQELLKYKAIVILEGNELGTGFKWALFSNSVVMTTAPLKFTGWAMEELLEPWVHYIPLDASSDLGEDARAKMQWVLENDGKAQEIARRGSLWIRDLLHHPDAVPDDEAVSDEIVRRYVAHFVYEESLSLPGEHGTADAAQEDVE